MHELSPDKMRLDQLYVRYRSFWLDLDVLFWTIALVMPRIRAYSPPERLLFVGPVTRVVQRYVAWFLWDFLVAFASIGLAIAAVRLFGPLDIGALRVVEMAIGFALLYVVVGVPLKTNSIKWPKATSWESVRLGVTWIAVTTIILGIHLYLGFMSLRTYGMILGASVLALMGIVFGRYRARLLNGLWSRLLNQRGFSGAPRERVLIVGSGRTAEHIAWLLDHPTYSGKFRVVGFIDDDLRSQGMTIYGAKVIGQVRDIQRITQDHDIGLIILADHRLLARKHKEFRDIANLSPVKVVVAPDIFGSLKDLNGGSATKQTMDDSMDFQCQYCLVRPKRAATR